jgi:hypothetical protein
MLVIDDGKYLKFINDLGVYDHNSAQWVKSHFDWVSKMLGSDNFKPYEKPTHWMYLKDQNRIFERG